jgi:hypothetical protein
MPRVDYEDGRILRRVNQNASDIVYLFSKEGYVGTKAVDETNLSEHKVLSYDPVTGKVVYKDIDGGEF